MSLPLQLVELAEPPEPGARVELRGAEAHHAVAVRRLRPGEQVLFTDGRGWRGLIVVEATDRRLLVGRVLQADLLPEPRPRVVVVQALPKGEHADRAVALLTEVGAAVIVPWAASRCVTQWRAERAERAVEKWRHGAAEAAKQSRRLWFPQVAELASTAEVLGLVSAATTAIVLHEASGGPIAEVPVPESGEIVIVVGPEGGLTDEEVAALAAAGAAQVRLGDEVLRTSTAGVVAVAALLARTARWGGSDHPPGTAR